MSGHQSKIPAAADAYFRLVMGAEGDLLRHRDRHPIIAQTFVPGRGWRRYGWVKRVSLSEIRKLRAAGVTAVALRCGSHIADFQIGELAR